MVNTLQKHRLTISFPPQIEILSRCTGNDIPIDFVGVY